MLSFLEQIVAELKDEYGAAISDLCIVVPTRRAVVFLREALARTFRQTLWAPRMLSIQDFVREQSGEQFPEIMPLVFELYQSYLERMRQDQPGFKEPFETFYAWGEMLVKDFDEIDKYLVDAEKLFTNIRDLKEIDVFFSLTEQELEPIRSFWETIRGRDEGPTEVQLKFLKIWEVLFDIYASYKERLKAKHLAYDGMAYRELVIQLENDEYSFPWEKIVFVGFNALSRAEEKIMDHLLDQEKALVYWDVDYAYFNPDPSESEALITGEEAGKFIHEYHNKWKDKGSRLILHDMVQKDKYLYHTGVPLQVGQAQYLGNLIQNLEIQSDDFRKIAIVLADENLLFPVLYALPDKIDQLNITMGFPLRQTNMFDLLQTVMRMLRNMRFNVHGVLTFSHKDVIEILNNPYIKAEETLVTTEIREEIHRKNLVFIPAPGLQQKQLSPLLAHIFNPPTPPAGYKANLEALLDYSRKIFIALLDDAQERSAHLEAEYLFQFYTQFNQLGEILTSYQPELSLNGFTRLFAEVLQRVRIPFEGEPLIGVQLMGFLETRVLDFEKVYILAANEGHLPDTSTGNSFVPYNLRKGFGLPTYEEKDAIYAYHFYRLIQRPSEVHLIYNTVVNDTGGAKEISRFIRQIRHFFRNQSHIHVREQVISSPAPFSEQPSIVIQADEATRSILQKKYLLNGKSTSGPYLSATAMTTWLACPLRFYYRYVAEIKEPDHVEESMEANTFGSVLHNTMEYLYKPLIGKQVDSETHEQLRKRLEACLKQAFDDQSLGWGIELQGKNYLLKGVIEKLCRRMLKMDSESEPFVVESLEDQKLFLTSLDIGNQHIRINGTLDRVDYLPDSDLVRIIDYKTGKVKLKPGLTVAECFEDDTYKEAFQGYLYAWLYQRRFPDKQVIVGYYTARHLSEGIQFLNQGYPIKPADLLEFEERLIHLIKHMLHDEYDQTEDETKCRYCVYKAICNRG